MKKKVLVTGVLVLLMIAGIFLFNRFNETGSVTQNGERWSVTQNVGIGAGAQNMEVVPLSPVERQVVVDAVLKTEFVKDIPEDEPVAIIFYDFETGERRLRDGFLINNKGFLSEGTPTVYVYLHSKYISELGQGDLCSVISQANKNGDLGTYSDYGNARLLLKYSGMLKHKSCLGL